MIRKFLKSIPIIDRAGRSIRWMGRLLRIHGQDERIFLTYPPGHYYSPLPNCQECQNHFDGIPKNGVGDLPGIDPNHSTQIEWIQRFSKYRESWPYQMRPTPPLRYYHDNIYLGLSDAFALAGLICELKPRRVVEIGSGYSSALMLDTVARQPACETKLCFIDPDPIRLNLLLKAEDRNHVTIHSKRVQEVSLDVFTQLEPNDILFIDSSHVSKIGSDVNHLFFEIFPRLRPGVLIHIHDVFWPFEYPRQWLEQGFAWNEAYLTRALLLGGSQYAIIYHPSYLEATVPDVVAASLPVIPGLSTDVSGSLWLMKKPC